MICKLLCLTYHIDTRRAEPNTPVFVIFATKVQSRPKYQEIDLANCSQFHLVTKKKSLQIVRKLRCK